MIMSSSGGVHYNIAFHGDYAPATTFPNSPGRIPAPGMRARVSVGGILWLALASERWSHDNFRDACHSTGTFGAMFLKATDPAAAEEVRVQF